MLNWPTISIVIPTFNRKELLSRCLDALIRLDYPKNIYEIIIIDDCSTDGAEYVCEGYLRSSSPRVHYIRQRVNLGQAAARNTGIQSANGEYLAFIDDDCCPDNNWLKEIARTFKRYPDATAVGGSIINGTDSGLAWASYILEFSSWFPAGKARRVNNIPACNIAYKKCEVVNYLFPEDYKEIGFEDSLFNYTIIRAGKTIIFNPKIRITHYRGKDYFRRENFYFCQKRYALGFLKGGHRVFGNWGTLLIKRPILNLFSPRIILVFFRCLQSWEYTRQFILNVTLIIRGEWLRNKTIYLAANKRMKPDIFV
ncbi:MAG: glycosyltransferase [Candidatus Omnitrophota bacterium]|jgi:glycosyltransferase involved in cell wall biosynthesis